MNRHLESRRKFCLHKTDSSQTTRGGEFMPGFRGTLWFGKRQLKQHLVDGFVFGFALSNHSSECLLFNFNSINAV